MKYLFNHILITVVASLVFIPSHATTRILGTADAVRMEAWVDSVFQTLTPEERLGQLIIPIIGYSNDTPAERQNIANRIKNFHIGGLLFSAGTITGHAQLTNYGQSLSKVPLLITLDGEWGLNMRLKDATRFPRNMSLGCINDSLPTASGKSLRDSLLFAYGSEVARECRLMNIQVDFAPVLDVNSNPRNPVIGNRSFGDDYEAVSRAAIAYSSGLEEGGIMAVGKHFPGHGDTDKDSHKTLPLLNHSRQRMFDKELLPFSNFINQGFAGIMVGHLAIPSLMSDTTIPSSASPQIVTGVLKGDLNFDGLVFTDGMAMEGCRRVPDIAVKALNAGVDVLIDPTPLEKQWASLKNAIKTGTLSQDLVDEKCRKVLRYKYASHLNDLKPIDTRDLVSRVSNAQSKQLARDLYTASLCVLKNESNNGEPLLPLKQLAKRNISVFTVGGPASNSFTSMLANYAPVSNNALNSKMTVQNQAGVMGRATTAPFAIIAVRNGKAAEAELTQKLCDQMHCPYILCFFTTPYRMTAFKKVIDKAAAVILAHDESIMAQEIAAQAIFGGCNVSGRLGVNLPSIFPYGTGVSYNKTRLGYAEPEKVGMSSETMLQIDSLVYDALAVEATPGCQVLIAKDGYIIYNKGFGYQDYSRERHITTHSIYDLASVSKAAATVPALMLARDKNGIHLSDKLSTYIPQMHRLPASVPNRAEKQALTIREALYHETGLRDSYPFYQMAIDTAGLGRLYSSRPDSIHCIRQDRNLYFNKNMRFDTLLVSCRRDSLHPLQIAHDLYLNPVFEDSILQKIIDLPLKKRGSYRYSCLNFVLLRHVIENATRQPLDRYLHDQLYAPLGAQSLCYNPWQNLPEGCDSLLVPTEDDDAIRRQRLRGYVHDEIAAFSGGVEGNAGLFGSAQDLAKVLQLLLNNGVYGGERLLNTETCKLFTGSKSPRSRRGLGFDKPNIGNPNQGPTAPECPVSVYGHTGYTGTCFWVDPDRKMIYIFLSNRVQPHRWNTLLSTNSYRSKIQSLLYPQQKKAASAQTSHKTQSKK